MKKVSVLNNITSRSFGAIFDTIEDANVWIAAMEAKAVNGKGWGYCARQVIKSELPAELSSLVLSEETIEDVVYSNLAAEYTITIEDYTESLDVRRQREYDAQGATNHELIVALWEKYIEDRADSATALQAIRVAVKTAIPE